MAYAVDPEIRFWQKVEKSNDCWIWFGSTAGGGYGQFSILGKKILAHRYRFMKDNGYLPEVVMHTCDNPPCVNPEHLVPGTYQDNAKDMVEKHRHRGQKKIYCKRGHMLSDSNVYLEKGYIRKCKTCHADRQRLYRKGA